MKEQSLSIFSYWGVLRYLTALFPIAQFLFVYSYDGVFYILDKLGAGVLGRVRVWVSWLLWAMSYKLRIITDVTPYAPAVPFYKISYID